MPYVITQNCCNDASCVAVCPVGCIHPTPEEREFTAAEMLYIDAAKCIDCGACADACPVDAIRPGDNLDDTDQHFVEINAGYYRGRQVDPVCRRTDPPTPLVTSSEPLSVAIVGAGAAGFYCAAELLKHPGIRVDMFERLDAPYGLVRYGVAPDHPDTKQVVTQFEMAPRKVARFRLHLGTEVGVDVSHDDLLGPHDAIVYAYGAADHNRLDIAGESLPGVVPAREVAAWYNGHPDHRRAIQSLNTATRAVIIGNGNVALDISRILATDPQCLAENLVEPEISATLAASAIEEIVILGRRGPEHASFTTPELLGLAHHPDIDLVVDPADLPDSPPTDHRTQDLLKILSTAAAAPRTGRRRIRLQFHTVVTRIVGEKGVAAVETMRTHSGYSAGDVETIDTGLVIPAIGFRGSPQPGLPFDERTNTVPNVGGRVVDSNGEPVPGTYVTGWIKRGPVGVIGTNRTCAQETIAQLLVDHRAGLLGSSSAPRSGRWKSNPLHRIRSRVPR